MRVWLQKSMVCMTGENIDVLRGVPHRIWDDRERVWKAPLTDRVLGYLDPFLSPEGRRELRAHREQIRAPHPLPEGFEFKTKPFPYQLSTIERMRSRRAFGLLMHPGMGKTFILINDTSAAFLEGTIQAGAVVCPNSITSNWQEEIETHCGVPHEVHIYDPDRKKAAKEFIDKQAPPGVLKFFIIAVESLSSGEGAKFLEDFIRAQDTSLMVDESSRIKTHSAARTKTLIRLAPFAKLRRIATGTAITRGLQDAWSQFQFLSNAIFRMSYYPFRNFFCRLGGYKGKQVVGSQNEDLFVDLTADYVMVARKEDHLSLPSKVHVVRHVEPSAAQMAAYQELKLTGKTVIEGGLLSYTNALVRDLRLQQICGGFTVVGDIELATPPTGSSVDDFFASLEGGEEQYVEQITRAIEMRAVALEGPNPKIAELMDVIEEEAPEKLIIWCRFRPEIEAIAARLRALEDGDVLEFHGGIPNADRTTARQRFQNDPKARFFVAQVSTGGIGITLTASHTAIYFSNSWSVEDRIQSEDRNHRIGQTKNPRYIDLLLRPPRQQKWTDTRVYEALKEGVDYTHYLMQQMKDAASHKESR